MNKKNDKKLCWSCEGQVELVAERCPYCGTDLAMAATGTKMGASIGNMSSFNAPYTMSSSALNDPPPPPSYPGLGTNNYTPSNKEWEEALQGDSLAHKNQHEEVVGKEKHDMFALLLLLPGIVFFLFGIVLLLFSQEGVFTLRWHQNFSYFYFVGALPLLYLGYKALK